MIWLPLALVVQESRPTIAYPIVLRQTHVQDLEGQFGKGKPRQSSRQWQLRNLQLRADFDAETGSVRRFTLSSWRGPLGLALKANGLSSGLGGVSLLRVGDTSQTVAKALETTLGRVSGQRRSWHALRQKDHLVFLVLDWNGRDRLLSITQQSGFK